MAIAKLKELENMPNLEINENKLAKIVIVYREGTIAPGDQSGTDKVSKPSQMSDQEKLTYETYMTLREGEMDRLFQRINFILISMAFLIGAVAALLSLGHIQDSLSLKLFVILIIASGISLNIAFTVSNQFNNDNIGKLQKAIRGFENNNQNLRAFTQFAEGNHNGGVFAGIGPVPITVLIPAGFIAFWFVSGFFILNFMFSWFPF